MDLPPEMIEDIRIIKDSNQFDHEWYLQKYPDVAKVNLDPVVHYVLWGATESRNPSPRFSTSIYLKNVKPEVVQSRNPFAHFLAHGTFDLGIDCGLFEDLSTDLIHRGIQVLAKMPLFSETEYQKLNLDIEDTIGTGSISLTNHAFSYGFPEGRTIFSRRRIAQVLGDVTRQPIKLPPMVAEKKSPGGKPLQIGVYHNRAGNMFIKEIAEGLVQALLSCGQKAILCDDTSPINSRPPHTIVVAPHEFFHIGNGQSWVFEEFLRDAVMYNTEQPQTLWFDRAVPFILMSRGVLDISYQVAEIFRQSGLPAMHLDPNILVPEAWLIPGDETHPLVKVLPERARQQPRRDAAFASRPIDIAFFGNTSAHRDKFFARAARFLADFDNFLYYRRFTTPLGGNKRDDILTRLGAHVAGHSKIWLNIHRDDYGFFEWHRIVQQGMIGGSVVVTEPTLPHPIYQAGTHFLEETGRHMPNLLDWLLRSSDGQAAAVKIQQAVAKTVAQETGAANGRKLLQFITKTAKAKA